MATKKVTTVTLTIGEVKEKLHQLAQTAANAAIEQNQKMVIEDNINGKNVRCTVTPQANPKRKPYTLVYVNGQRKAFNVAASVLTA